MKNALIVLGVVALVVLTLGAFNREASLDVDYVVGVWRSVNVFWLFLIAAGVVLAAGLLGAALARAQGWRERGKLEKELLDVYRRLRTAEAEAARAAGAAGTAAAAAEARTMAAAGETAAPTAVGAPEEATTAVAAPDEASTAVSAPDEARTAVSAPDEASTAVSAPDEDRAAAAGQSGDAAEPGPTGREPEETGR